ncbi:TonB-dependent receptor [Pedobacter yulinensis]|uniref:TonB-dependent receptor n=1 Tax=Pedobacter yulinensis TaxID=2126353 RepID=A0A2T3HNJ3_9SPHI|nr:TonB-dependent receptor [Pedobacter yulinensis]PST84015.1 TonB-dependent receptor [Pedobacter yulinensis]
MKKLSFLLFSLFVLFFSPARAAAVAELKGKVVDAASGSPLPGASVYIADLRAVTTTDARGFFVLPNVPAKGRFLVEVRYVGYKTRSQFVDVAKGLSADIALEPSAIEAAEVVITGSPFSSNNRTNSLSVVGVSKDQLRQTAGTNIIDALAKIPGVAQVTTGGAISKPVIRGLGYNRVLTMIDGAREEAQQWGDEHGAQADQFAAARIEILKGPASLLYGSDALGGVINILDDYAPAEGTVNGEFITTYSTNNGLTASSLMMQGNDQGFVYRGRLSYKNAYSYGYKAAVVPNSGFDETNGSAMLGLNRNWGYSHLNLSWFNTNVGLVEEGPDDDGRFRNEEGELLDKEASRVRRLGLPNQNINHYRAVWNNNLILGRSRLRATLGFQKNVRKEFEESASEPGLNLDLNSYTYDFKYYFANNGKWEPVVGLQGMYQENANKGDEFLIPDYNSNNIGVFGYLKRTFGKGAINLGARYDYKKVNGFDLMTDEDETVFNAFHNRFSNFSGSAGAAFELTKNVVLKGNVGSGFRAPNLAELGANGRHEGTFRYEIGNSALKQENSLQADLALEYSGNSISASLNAYANRIYNYIYPGNFGNEQIDYTNEDGETEVLPVYRFVQTNADLVGAEASLDIHPVRSLHFENTFAYTRGTNRADGSALPFIPAATINNELRFEPQIKGLADTYIRLSVSNVFGQKRFEPEFETATAAYTLFDAGIGTGFKTRRGGELKLWITGQNLLNKEYFNHLSRYKYAQRNGIYNPGRNVTFGLSVPLM